jgi:excinuclease UvrABC nuclease subunit
MRQICTNTNNKTLENSARVMLGVLQKMIDCSDCNTLYKERKQKPPCESCEIGKKLQAEADIIQAEYLSYEEQAKAQAEEEARQEAEAEAELEEEDYTADWPQL